MKALLPLLFLALSVCVYAQRSALRVEPATVVKDVIVDDLDEEYQDITTLTVTNDSPRSIQLVRKQVIIGKPASWVYGTFSRRNRNAPYVISESTTSNDQPVGLAPGESATFHVVLQPDGVAGDGRMEVHFSDLNVPGQLLGKAVVTTEIIQRAGPVAAPVNSNVSDSGTAQGVPTTVRLYPNPARERFFVETPPGIKLGRIEVSNTLGKRILLFDRPAGKDGYDVEDLPDGLYLISIFDDKGKKLKTLRLLHRQFGA